mgnify:CR=1 FL=1|tara:strand:- start:1610 stop:2164 length:555 start_codon:yes stop_codon:yes gene_type:complete
MKKIEKKIVILLFFLFLFSCKQREVSQSNEVNICRCLNEPGNTEWSRKNKKECNEVISNKIGVSNWMSVNFSQSPTLSAKWDDMVNDCVDNQLENDSKEISFQEISFNEAKAFIEQRFSNVGQILIDSKITYHNDGGLKVYYFISKNKEHSGYYCLAGMSSKKLELLANIDCGRDEILLAFKNK